MIASIITETRMRKIMLIQIMLIMLGLLLSACATHKQESVLNQTLDAYEAEIRWGDMGAAMRYLDPELLKKSPPTELQLARYKQVRISGYDELGTEIISSTEIRQKVRIHLINVHTQVERIVMDNQVWRYDPKAERWWLHSGLPEIVGP